MTVINKSRFFLIAGCLVSTICLSKVDELVKITPIFNSSSVAVSNNDSIKTSQNGSEESTFESQKVQMALASLRKNVNLSTSELLASPTDY